jgi:hypothetical protein
LSPRFSPFGSFSSIETQIKPILVYQRTLRVSFELIDKIDWHDYKFINYEKSRTGPGENGSAVILSDPKEKVKNEIGYKRDGFYTVVSDKISPNRSLPDIRLEV